MLSIWQEVFKSSNGLIELKKCCQLEGQYGFWYGIGLDGWMMCEGGGTDFSPHYSGGNSTDLIDVMEILVIRTQLLRFERLQICLHFTKEVECYPIPAAT